MAQLADPFLTSWSCLPVMALPLQSLGTLAYPPMGAYHSVPALKLPPAGFLQFAL